MRKRKLVVAATIFSLLFLFQGPVEAKFINLFVGRVGGSSLNPGDEVKLAKFDILILHKSHYDDIGGDSWGRIKAINSEAEIYLYTHALFVGPAQDSFPTVNLTSLGRYNVSRGHSMGSLNGDNPELFLLDSDGKRVEWVWPTSTRYMLDFGDRNYRSYAVEALVANNVDQPWTSDGVISDYMHALINAVKTTPVKYNTNALWSAASIGFINALTVGLSAQDLKFGCSRGFTKFSEGADAWLALDASENPPAFVQEEGAFAAKWGDGDIQFLRESQWKRQVDLLSTVKNSKVLFKASTDLSPDESGIDFHGKSVNFWDGLWFALGSYLVGKNDIKNNSYLEYHWGTSSNVDHFYDEYDKIDLGNAISSYNISNINGHNIYWREFDYGYVFVNPTLSDVASIPLPEPCKQRTHGNLNSDLGALPDKNSISLNSHRAAILYKSDDAPDPPSPPGDEDNNIWLEAEAGDLHVPMKTETDNDASDGGYIQTTISREGYAEYSFDVTESGTYYIWGRAKAIDAGKNSFYFSTDNGNDVTWALPISSNWGWDQAVSAYFAAGKHTLIIKGREKGTQLDKILITNDPNYVPQGLGVQTTTTPLLWLEAEDGDLSSPMQIAADINASSGEYIQTTISREGYAEYSFDVSESGTYYIWGRAKAIDAGKNSFYFSTDNGNDVTWALPISSNWGWDRAVSAYFAAGKHTLIIKGREKGTQLDKILITSEPDYVP